MDDQHSEFEVEFMDGHKVRITAFNFICAAVEASNQRMREGAATSRELTVKGGQISKRNQ